MDLHVIYGFGSNSASLSYFLLIFKLLLNFQCEKLALISLMKMTEMYSVWVIFCL